MIILRTLIHVLGKMHARTMRLHLVRDSFELVREAEPEHTSKDMGSKNSSSAIFAYAHDLPR